MKLSREQIASRALTGRCPNCGHFSIFRSWFRLHRHCPSCQMQLEKDESGFYLGTTSVGYVLAVLLVILPVCILVVQDVLTMWVGIGIGIAGSLILCTLLYPLMLCWVILLYYTVQAEELPANQDCDQ